MFNDLGVFVVTVNHIEGFHNWPGAPESVNYLMARHRHIFHVECHFKVTDEDRQIEIITQQNLIYQYFKGKYGFPAEFGSQSCEMIAHDLLDAFPDCSYCAVKEDGLGGAFVVRE